MPEQVMPLDLSLVTARLRSITTGHLAGTKAVVHAIMQLRVCTQSEAYVVYYLGQNRFLTVWFNGTAQDAYGPASYLNALDAFCEAAHMPALDSRQKVTWEVAEAAVARMTRPCYVCRRVSIPAATIQYQGKRPMHFCVDHAAQVTDYAPEDYAVSVRRTVSGTTPDA